MRFHEKLQLCFWWTFASPGLLLSFVNDEPNVTIDCPHLNILQYELFTGQVLADIYRLLCKVGKQTIRLNKNTKIKWFMKCLVLQTAQYYFCIHVNQTPLKYWHNVVLIQRCLNVLLWRAQKRFKTCGPKINAALYQNIFFAKKKRKKEIAWFKLNTYMITANNLIIAI